MNEHVKGLVDAARVMVRNAQLRPLDLERLNRVLDGAEHSAKVGWCGLAVADVQFVLAHVSVLSPSLYEGPPQ